MNSIEEVNMKNVLVFLIVLLGSFTLFSDVVNPDKPLKGQWDFKLKKVWEFEKIGDHLMADPGEPLVAADGRIYLKDHKACKSFILDKNGKLLKIFATRGEGPGEVKLGMETFLTKDRVIVADFERLHFFTPDGEYIKFEKNIIFRRRPVLFLDGDRFISKPFTARSLTDTKGAVKIIDLKTGKETVITQFDIFTGGSIRMQDMPRREVTFPGLSPLMTIGHGDGRLYYGMSDTYAITIADLQGKKLGGFSVDRKAKSISDADKQKLISKPRNTPDKVVKYLMKNIPNKSTYFYRIESHKGMIYVFIPSPLKRLYPDHYNPAGIDIFSPEGKYMYSAKIKVEPGRKPLSMSFAKDSLIMFSEGEDGDIFLVKYSVSLPGS